MSSVKEKIDAGDVVVGHAVAEKVLGDGITTSFMESSSEMCAVRF